MGVIIGPVIIPEDGLIGGGSGWSPDYSSSNLSPNTPYADGALRGYSTIGVYNVVRDTKVGMVLNMLPTLDILEFQEQMGVLFMMMMEFLMFLQVKRV